MWADPGVCPRSQRTLPGHMFISERQAYSYDSLSPPPSPSCILLHHECLAGASPPPSVLSWHLLLCLVTQMSCFPCDWRLLAPLNIQGGEAERTRSRGGGDILSSLPFAHHAQGIWSLIFRACSGKIRV